VPAVAILMLGLMAGCAIYAMPANAFPAHTTYSRSVHIQTKGSHVMNTEVSTDSSTVARSDRIKRLHDLPALRFDIDEAKEILRMSRAQLYIRIAEGGDRDPEGWSADIHLTARVGAIYRGV
jgi:hypothetical protein